MLQVLHKYYRSVHHILRLKNPTKNQHKKTPADEEHDLTLAAKQSVQEGWIKKVLLHERKTTPINKISGQDLKEMYIFTGQTWEKELLKQF